MDKKSDNKAHTVSVILILHKDPPQLVQVLDCLKNQSYDKKKTKIICLDDGTSPKSQLKLKQSGVIVHKIPYNSNISFAKNFALIASKDEYIFYLDDRLSLDSNAIEEAVNVLCNNPDIAGVCGYYPAPKLSDWNVLRDIKRESIYGKADKERKITLRNFSTFSTGIGVFRREVLEKFPFPEHDFPNDFGGEDVPVILAALNNDYKFMYSPKIRGYHEHNLSFLEFIKKIEIEVRGRYSLLYWVSNYPHFEVPYLHGFMNFPLFFLISFPASWILSRLNTIFLLLPIFPLFYEVYLSFQCFKTPIKRPFIYVLRASLFVLCSDLLSIVCWAQYLVSDYKRPFKSLKLRQFFNINKIYINWELVKYGIRK